MKQETVNTLVRNLLTLLGAFLIGGGVNYLFGRVIDTPFWEELTGFILTGISLVWGLWDKTLAEEKIESGLRQVATFLLSFASAKGLLKNEQVQAILFFIGGMVPFVLSWYQKRKADKLKQGTIAPQQLTSTYSKATK